MNEISFEVKIPQEIVDMAREGLFKKSDWRKVFRVVETEAMGAGGVLEQNFNSPEVQAPLAPSTLRRKQQQGLPQTPLVGKRGRIKKAVSSASSGFRSRRLGRTKRGVHVYNVMFNPKKFQVPGKKDPYTRILQSGRLKSFKTRSGDTIDRAEMLSRQNAGVQKIDPIVQTNRITPRPIMSYREANDGKLRPALEKAVHSLLKAKGLA